MKRAKKLTPSAPTTYETLAELAALQAEDARDDAEFLAHELRRALTGWRLDVDGVPDDVVVRTQLVSATYSIAALLKLCTAAFQDEFTKRAQHQREAWAHDVSERHPRADAERIIRILISKVAAVHAKEAARAFVALVPRCLELATALALDAAFAHARVVATERYGSLREIETGEEVELPMFDAGERVASREEIMRRFESEVRRVLVDLAGKAGRPSKTAEYVEIYRKREQLYANHCAAGASHRVAQSRAKRAVMNEYGISERTYQNAIGKGRAACGDGGDQVN